MNREEVDLLRQLVRKINQLEKRIDKLSGQEGGGGAGLGDTDDLAEGSANLYYTTERAQDAAGGMFSGNTETGISATYDDGTGKINLDAQTAGDARYARLAASNTFTAIQTIVTSGVALLTLDGAAAASRALRAFSGGVARATVAIADATAESGSNAGSNFSYNAFDDAGVFLGTWWGINRGNGRMQVGSVAPVTAQLHIKQPSTTAAIPVMKLDQADVSEPMIELACTIGTGNGIEAVGAKTLTTTHFIKVLLPGGLTRYIPCGTIA